MQTPKIDTPSEQLLAMQARIAEDAKSAGMTFCSACDSLVPPSDAIACEHCGLNPLCPGCWEEQCPHG